MPEPTPILALVFAAGVFGMDQETEQSEGLEQNLLEIVASILAKDQPIEEADDLTFVYLDELNRLWAEPAPF